LIDLLLIYIRTELGLYSTIVASWPGMLDQSILDKVAQRVKFALGPAGLLTDSRRKRKGVVLNCCTKKVEARTALRFIAAKC
jgi:hypothetical protein